MSKDSCIKYPNKSYKAYSCIGKISDYSSKELHWHSYHEILLIKNGVSILIDEKLRQPLFGTSTAFIPANILHRSLVVGKSLEFIILFIHESLFPLDIQSIKIFNLSELGIALFNKLCSVKNVEITEGFIGECFNLFLTIIKEDLKNESTIVRLPESKEENNLKIIDFIHKNYNRKLNISDFEKVVPYTSRHFSRLFSNELKISIFEYLRLYRILMASILIANNNTNITDIAFECGYESLSSFYKDFNSYFGISPKELRKNSLSYIHTYN